MTETIVANGGYAIRAAAQASGIPLGSGASYDDTAFAYANLTSASVNPTNDVLTLSSAGGAVRVQLSGVLNSASIGLSSDGAGGTEIVDFGPSPAFGAPILPSGSAQQTVVLAGGRLAFVNTYGSGVTPAYADAIVTAEAVYQAQIANAATLDVTFKMTPGVGPGVNDFTTVGASFQQLEAALAAAATSPDDRASVAAMRGLASAFAGETFQVPEPLALLLGLPGASAGSVDTVQLDTTLSYFYNQGQPAPGALDAVAVLEHEISEGGLGRVGGDGSSPSPMDLFRYAAPGQPDATLGRDGAPAYFSVDGSNLLLQFHNPIRPRGYNDGADSADWDSSGTLQQPTAIPGQSQRFDAYGVLDTGLVGDVSSGPTDLRVLDVLGWTLSSLAPAMTPSAGASDFDADGHADLLWRNSNGATGLWLTGASGGYLAYTIGLVPTNWAIQAVGDFNGDGKADILWRDTASGQVVEWNSVTGSPTPPQFSAPSLGYVDLSWRIQGVGDFNGDGLGDILWRNTNGDTGVWLTNAAGGDTAVDFGVTDNSWQIQGTGDFNGDGKADILWRNTATGQVGEWLSRSGAGYTGFTTPTIATVDAGWKIQGVGDFTGAGLSDILWRNTGGDTGLWLTTAGGGYTAVDLGVVGLDWTIQGVADFNGDGKADILWRDSNGQVGEWLSKPGPGFTGFTEPILATVDPGWTLQGVPPAQQSGLIGSAPRLAQAMAAMGAPTGGASAAPAILAPPLAPQLIAPGGRSLA